MRKRTARPQSIPDVAALGRWLAGWVQPSGAIHGFHNHTVWGENPYHYQDMTCGHSTFAAPFVAGLAHALNQCPDPRGMSFLERMVKYQTSDVHADGQFDHIGFQIGDCCRVGLIHNVTPAAALCFAACTLGKKLKPSLRRLIDRTVRNVLATCEKRYGTCPEQHGCTNQDYCREWAKLLHMEAFGHAEWDRSVQDNLDALIAMFHVPGIPDRECQGTYRNRGDKNGLEPTEYYGLMMLPLLMAAKRYGRQDYFDAARAIGRHVARSAWKDENGLTRFHRTWHRVGGKWIKVKEPMLIGGMGFTMSGIQALVRMEPNRELEMFLVEIDRTYAAYQHPAGFFQAASGWGDMRDLIPATGWQAHDCFHLVQRHTVNKAFWNNFFKEEKRTAVVLGQSVMWMENKTYWAVRGYHWASSQDLVGRKDRARFHVDIPAWIGSQREAPPEMLMPDPPKILRTDDAFIHLAGRKELRVMSVTGKDYKGPGPWKRAGTNKQRES